MISRIVLTASFVIAAAGGTFLIQRYVPEKDKKEENLPTDSPTEVSNKAAVEPVRSP